MQISTARPPPSTAQPASAQAPRPQWLPPAEALRPAAPAAPAAPSPAQPQPALTLLQPILHILGALQQSPPHPAPQAAVQQHRQAQQQRLLAQTPARAPATAPRPWEAATAPAPASASLQPLSRMQQGWDAPQQELPTPEQPQPPSARSSRPPGKQRSGSRRAARADGVNGAQGGDGPLAGGASVADGARPRRSSSSRRRARGVAAAQIAQEAGDPAVPYLRGRATITTGNASPERRSSSGPGLVGSPRGLSLAPTAITTSPPPGGGPVRIVAAESPAPAAAAAAGAPADGLPAAAIWGGSHGNGTPAGSKDGWVQPLFVAGHGTRPFRYVLGGILRFDSPGARPVESLAGNCLPPSSWGLLLRACVIVQGLECRVTAACRSFPFGLLCRCVPA